LYAAQLFQSIQTGWLRLLLGSDGRGLNGMVGFWLGRTEPDAADVEVLFESVGLKQVGQFKGAYIAASKPDLFLEVGDDRGQVGQSKTGFCEVEPEPLAVEAQRDVLACEPAIGLMEA
ncbi:hypothetical protein, partial [Thermogutta sp.]|uniref:hypothetical protein n=1 Tax=Thermogutta sp. TaxID=1962930 RepID=UPI0032201302